MEIFLIILGVVCSVAVPVILKWKVEWQRRVIWSVLSSIGAFGSFVLVGQTAMWIFLGILSLIAGIALISIIFCFASCDDMIEALGCILMAGVVVLAPCLVGMGMSFKQAYRYDHWAVCHVVSKDHDVVKTTDCGELRSPDLWDKIPAQGRAEVKIKDEVNVVDIRLAPAK